jgi:hypothetical protein
MPWWIVFGSPAMPRNWQPPDALKGWEEFLAKIVKDGQADAGNPTSHGVNAGRYR